MYSYLALVYMCVCVCVRVWVCVCMYVQGWRCRVVFRYLGRYTKYEGVWKIYGYQINDR